MWGRIVSGGPPQPAATSASAFLCKEILMEIQKVLDVEEKEKKVEATWYCPYCDKPFLGYTLCEDHIKRCDEWKSGIPTMGPLRNPMKKLELKGDDKITFSIKKG